jgi:hypothetical protein
MDGAAMNIALTRAADGLPRWAFSADDIRRMVEAGVLAEDERIELNRGGNRRDVGERICARLHQEHAHRGDRACASGRSTALPNFAIRLGEID